MSKKGFFALWGGMFILCAVLGFIPEPAGFLLWLRIGLAVLFFLPPAMLLRQASENKDLGTVLLVRNLSALSLLATLALLIANFLSLMAPENVGNVLYAVLVIVSSPMICSKYWVLSLFLWACVLMTSLRMSRKK